MYYRNYSITELEKTIETKKSSEEKILFLSEEIIEANRFLENMRCAINSIKNAELAINTNEPKVDLFISDLLKNDGVLNNKIILNSICTIKDSLCESAEYFNDYAKNLLRHYWRQMKMEANAESIKRTAEFTFNDEFVTKLIVWKSSKEKLIKLFEVLHANEIIPYYEEIEILSHFLNERLEPFTTPKVFTTRFLWQDSDSSFAVFINELAKAGVIEDYNKFRNISEHFLNNRGEKFKYLSQKRNYSDNLNKKESLIKEILSFL